MRYIPKVALTVFLAITVVVSIFSFSYAGDVTEDFETWGFSNGTSASPEYVHNGWKFQSFYLGASATPSAIKLVTSPAALSLSDGAPVDELRIIKINELGNNVRFIFKGFYFTRTTLAPRKLKVTGWRNGAQVTGEIYYDYDDSTPDNTYCNVISDTGFQNVDEVRIAADEDVTEYNNNNVIDTVRKLDLYFEDFVYDATPVSSTAPILGNISGDSASYIEDSPHALLDAGTPAALTDADSTNMNGGKVTVEISSNRVPGEDVLCIQNQGAGSGQIGVSGSNVTYEGTTIGTYSGGTGVNNLVVSLNTSSSPAAIQSLIRALTYSNSNNANPDTSQRTISVTVDDGGGGISGTANVTVDVTRANDAPADIGLSNSSVPESAISGSTVGILSSTDVDIGDTTFTYALVSGAGDTDNASFAIDGTALETAAGFNYEAKNSYSIRVRATDAGGLWYEKQLTIAITNVNENPTGITLTNSTIAENSATGSAIGTFSSTDTDVIDTFTYALVSGAGDADNASFTIDGNILKTNTTFSYAAKNSYSIRVRTTDAGGLTYERQFTISISEVNAAPSDIAISSSSIAENSPSESAVGSLSTTDSNSGDVLFTYALVSGAGDTDNASFAIDGTALETAAGFNYEAKNSYSIRVRATDAGGLWYEKQFTITITNVNETPTDITLSNNSIAENTASGSSVGTLAGIDPDAGSSFTYALVSGAGDTDNASFAIDGTALETAAGFNYEAKNSYSIRLRATDAGGLWHEKQLTITITNVNETPTDITLSNNSIAENTASGSSVGTLAGIDPDAGSSFTYALVSGTGDADNVSFSLTGNTLKTNTTYSYALKNSYSIRIRATDAGGLWYEKQFLLNITEVNVAPVNISLSNNNAVENSVPGSTVGTFSTTDTNTVDSFTYTLVSGTGSDDNASFTTTGSALKLAVTPDYETKNSYKIRVRTTDSGGLFFEKEFTINITDINENPAPAPTPSPAPQTNDNRVEIIINDNTQKAATATVQEVDGKKVTTVTVDEAVIEEKLKNEPSGSTVVIPVNNNSDVVVGTLNGQTVSNMSEKEAVVEIRSERVTYTLPAAEINMDAVSEELGENVSLKDIEVSIRIAEPSQDTVRVVEDTANKNNYQIVVKPVEFEITCTNGDKTVQVQRFNGYVERTVAIPEGINPAMITTGIVLNADGTFSHVPTTVLVIDGKFYARINSLTNSTYSVIWNPRTFSDVSNHWGKADVDDIASRLIMDGISEDKFGPDAGITRAEFIDAVVRSLGLLRPGKETDRFKDVKKDNKYMASIAAAAEYGIVGGYSDGTLGPARLIAREEAMNILFRAMKVAGMDIDISDEEVKSILSNIRDRDRISKIAVKAAAVCVKYDIFRGGKAKKLTLDAKITRAQTAAIIKRMLTAANLI